MLIALDFDGTYTLDPVTWNDFIVLMKSRGHRVIYVTSREPNSAMATEVSKALASTGITIIFSGTEFKRTVTERFGYKVDVWIDDFPSMIEKQIFIGQ